MGKCTVNIQRIPSLDAAARGTHLPVSRRQIPDPADPNSNNNGVDTLAAAHAVRNRKTSADEIQGLHRQTVEARRRQDRQLPGQRLATEGRSGHSSDRASAVARRPDGTSSSDSEDSDCLIQDKADNPIWPNMDPKQGMITARQREEEARRRYLMGIYRETPRGSRHHGEQENQTPGAEKLD